MNAAIRTACSFSTALLVLPAFTLPALAHSQSSPANEHTPPQRAEAKLAPPPAGPTVNPDRTITFRFPAPRANQVELNLEGANSQPMTKGADGIWTITTRPLAPEYYGYDFRADGVSYLDPGSVEIKPNLLNLQNEIEVPGPQPMDWDTQNVPHGVVHHHYYFSKTLDRESDYFVYTPPDYNPKQKYPVLYLLHGYSDNASGWTAVGRANSIFDNLIAQNKIKPMIVVMPLGYGTMEMITNAWGVWQNKALVDKNYQLFTQILIDEIMPLASSQYSIASDRDQHAIAGLSMGGGESLRTGLTRLDDFAYVGGFSSAIAGNYDQTFPQLASEVSAKKDRLRLLWVSCGSDDPLLTPNLSFISWLKQQKVPVTFTETPAGRHTWMVWRQNLIDFAPLLFRK